MYDTIVIGNDLSSLVAAAVISHHGKKTALLSEGDAKHVYSDFGYTFNIDPLPLTGFGPAQICSRLLEDLGIPAHGIFRAAVIESRSSNHSFRSQE